MNRRFQTFLGDSTIRVKELTTGGGFLINSNDTIKDVISDGDVLKASDYNEWIQTQVSHLSSWYKTSRTDFADKKNVIYVEVGRHKHNKFYVKMGENQGISRLELFTVSDLHSFGKGGKPLIAREQTKNKAKGIDRYVEASFIVEKGVVKGVELIIKATSDVRTQIEHFALEENYLLDDNLDEKCRIPKVLQPADPQPPKGVTYQIGAAKVTGKSLENFVAKGLGIENDNPYEPAAGVDLSANKGEGDFVGIDVEQKDLSQIDRGRYDADTKSFYQYFYSNISLINKDQENKIMIGKVESEWYDEKAKVWKKSDSISLGSKSRAWYYSWERYDADGGWNIPPADVMQLAIRTGIEVKARQFDALRLIHPSLPNPIKLRFTLFDIDKTKSKSIVVVVKDVKKIEVETTATRLKGKAEDFVEKTGYRFFSADDVEAGGRLWGEFYSEESGSWGTVIKFASNVRSKSKYFYADDIRQYLYTALKDSQEKILIEDLSSSEADAVGRQMTVHALVDLKNKYAYAFEVALITAEGSTTARYAIPADFFACK
eukprot:TRINITY_DN11153_c0_g1_i1.p1 TRINITY_DN11153_c0_g1~~TRINITY_DN11153_c0_g1_i1.p1  ORF type:complete len:580 (-),score=108.83 TRINITY_DN11153_c0_g1_i1:55-1689(-)